MPKFKALQRNLARSDVLELIEQATRPENMSRADAAAWLEDLKESLETRIKFLRAPKRPRTGR